MVQACTLDKNVTTFLKLIACILIATCLLVMPCQAKTLNIAIGEYPPYSTRVKGEFNFVPSVIRAAYQTQGYSVKFSYFPWGRSLVEAKKDNYDIAAYWFCTQEKQRDFYCSDALYTETTYFFYNVNNPISEWKSISDFQGKLIGVTTGYSYTNELLNEGKRGTFGLDWAKTDKQNLARLIKGHIDTFPMSLIPAEYLLKTQFSKSQRKMLAYSKKALLSDTAHLLFRKDLPHSEMYRQAFNKGLAEIKQNGVYERLLKQLPHHTEIITN
ncbi:substrate-binding periplasmic protein [Pseudoalteromonas sp. G4]|uniref:substrate-binding periplasmic protein n=1 Tax=Pseudoalteromonas sp. G4 TaxID=2992761 RepID=UPI00237DED70|nr:transporter substrate-binding domain-containing protein [Pseudoalteromonas sp. G4]MDE3272880.1 transporter substrate-binding domain-containing protein [Pseudoalteromonas sp. G4]